MEDETILGFLCKRSIFEDLESFDELISGNPTMLSIVSLLHLQHMILWVSRHGDVLNILKYLGWSKSLMRRF